MHATRAARQHCRVDVANVALTAALEMFDDWDGDMETLLMPDDDCSLWLTETETETPSSPSAGATSDEADGGDSSSPQRHAYQHPHRLSPTASVAMRPFKKPRKRCAKGTTTKRREEIESLRATVERLTRVLVCETQRRARSSSSEHDDTAVDEDDGGVTMNKTTATHTSHWRQAATRQFNTRRDSETENAHLRGMLKRERALVEELVQLRTSSLAYLTKRPRTSRHDDETTLTRTTATAEQHEQSLRLDAMYAQFEQVLASLPFGSARPSVRHVEVTSDGCGGAVVVVNVTWSTSFGVRRVADHLWRHRTRDARIWSENEQHGRKDVHWECLSTVQRDNHLTTLCGNATTREYRTMTSDDGDVDLIVQVVSTMTGKPVALSMATAPSRVVIRGEEWVRVHDQSTSLATTAAAHVNLPRVAAQVEWSSRFFLTQLDETNTNDNASNEGNAHGTGSSDDTMAFAEHLATHLADEMQAAQATVENALLADVTQ